MSLKHIPLQEFPIEWETNILKLLPKRNTKKYSSVIQTILKEAKDMYIKDMQDCTMTIIFSLPAKDVKYICARSNEHYRFFEERKSYSYKIYSIHRTLLRKKYFLSLEPVRHIINVAELKLPTIICNFEHYYKFESISLNDFQNIITSDIKKSSLIIINQFYIETCRIIAESKVLQSISSKKLLIVMKCITNIFVQQIFNVMMRSINHMLNIMSNGVHCPQIKYQLILQDSQLLINPNIKEICSMYHGIIDNISAIAQDLIPLEEWLNIKTDIKYIKVKLPDWYLKKSHNKLQDILHNLFEPLNKYIKNITEEFYPICAFNFKKRILSTSDKISFDLYYKQVQKYNVYLTKANEIVGNKCYNVGKLDQNAAKESLKKQSSDIVNTFIFKLIKFHQEFNVLICSEFEDINKKALDIPKDAKSLIELTEYMSYASKVLVEELECKIRESIRMLRKLLEVTVLTEDHIELNERCINWLNEIEPIFRQNHTLCEAMKNEIEDSMQRRINELNSEVDNIVPQLNVLDSMDDINRVSEYVEYYKQILKQANSIKFEMQKINEEEILFKFPETEFPKVTELYEIIIPFYDLIYIIYKWQKDNAVWLDGPFEWLDAASIKKKTVHYFERVTEMSRTFKSKIKMDLTANKCFKFSGIADDPDPMQQPTPLKLCWQALNDINDFKKYLPLVMCMCNSALKKRHWIEMSEICKFNIIPNAGTSLRKIIAFDLINDIEKYEAISISANKELQLQQKVLKMMEEWNKISFAITVDTKSSIYTFSHLSNIEVLLEEHLVIIEEVKTSNFVKPIISTVTEFYTSLVRIQESIKLWDCIQELLSSLDSIFCYPVTKTCLLNESILYMEVNKDLTNIQNKLSECPTFVQINNPAIIKSLHDAIEKLEKVNQGVQKYIEAKKLYFPRFFFLSNIEIQKIVFQSSNLEELHALLNKCFEGISKVKIDKAKSLYSIIGHHGEELKLEQFISYDVYSDHECKWLLCLENEISNTIRRRTFQCHEVFHEAFAFNKIANFPSMVIICIFQLYWTAEVHNCLTPLNLKALEYLYSKYINHLTYLINKIKQTIRRRHRDILTSLIIIVITQKDVIRLLLEKKITKSTEFEWVAQLKYYMEENSIQISMFDTILTYGYEYSYYKQIIVNTSLTDRCFHTLMQAYKYNLYGNVTGLSASGKTETIKSLAKAIAVQFRIFNCTDTLTYNFLCQICKGFISSNVWLCFKNFEKLQTEVLYMIGESFTYIAQKAATAAKVITFEGSTLNLNPNGQICITTNLSSSKYYNLSDNLKALFRPISMMIPDITRIIEIELFAAGLSDSKLLATKLVTFYKILATQLWCKSCSTFNIYSVRTVTKTTIYLKRSSPDESEIALLLRSLIDVNIPKFCNKDILIFNNILHNMFPDTVLLTPNYTVFLKTLESVCKSKTLYIHDVFKLKIIQAFELMYVHQAVLLVGDPFVGKTEIINILANVLSCLQKQGVEFGANVKLETVVPGVININQFFGYFDENLKIWKNGIFSNVLNSFSVNNTYDKKWIVFDGPLNDVCIESLYAIVDTNKVLYTTTGKKINTINSVSIIFETLNIYETSPAILPICGIIYIESSTIAWQSYVKTYVCKHNICNGYEEILYSLCDWLIDPLLLFIQKHCTLTSSVGQLHHIISMLNLLEMFLKDAQTENSEEKGKGNHFITWLQAALILSTTWGLGGNLNNDSHIKFNSFCVSLWSGTNKQYPKPEIIKNFDITLPHEGLIQDNCYIFKGVGNWKYWGDFLRSEKVLDIPANNEMFVPTIDTLKYNYIFLKHITHKKSFLLSGDTSIGKTFSIRHFLKHNLSKGYLINFFSFASLHTVNETQQLLLSKLNKIRRAHYGPSKNEFCINFIDDLNLETSAIKSGIPGILELFRQYYGHGYFYDINTPEKVVIHDTMFLFTNTGNTGTKICPRFLRYFNIYTMHIPSTDILNRIFTNVLFVNLKRNSFAADILNTASSITNATIDIYSYITERLRPTPTKFQYQFCIRDISRVINGCSLLQKESAETKITFIRLWAHEVWRVFGDRILENDDKNWLFLQIKEIIKHHFKDSCEAVFDYLPKFEKNQITKDSFNNLMFSNFMDAERNRNRRYEEINSIEKLKNKILSYLNEYNSTFKKQIDIVVTQFVLECLIKISRVLAIPEGNLLVISGIGSGRKSLTSLAAYIQEQDLYEPSAYSYNDFNIWRKDLKTVLQTSGGLRKHLTFLLKDVPKKDEYFRDICSLLTTWEIPNLFSTQEKHNIIEMVRLYAQGGNRNTEIGVQFTMNYFFEQCKNNLHIVLCFNSANGEIRSCLHKYPELIKYFTINWYGTWPTSALTQIGSKYFQNINVQENMKADIIQTCVQLYKNTQAISSEYYKETGRVIRITLSAFLHMLKLYTQLISKKQEEIVLNRNRYLAGLEKLEFAAQQVANMKTTLTVLKPQLELSAQQTLTTMKEVENKNISVESATTLVQQEEEIANKKAEIAGRLKMECEADLGIAIPILEDAIAALNTLKPTDITLVKAMKNPPDTVKLVMAAVCVMFEISPDKNINPVTGKKYTDYWGPSKRILGDMNFLQNLKDYDKDNIPLNVTQTIKKTYMTDNNFKPHIVAKASSAAEGLCKWVRAMVSYDEVAKAVAPKKEKLLAAQMECNEAEAFLNQKRRKLAALRAKLADLNNSLQETLQQKLKLENEVEDCTTKLKKAENLIAGLEGEKSHWLQCAEDLQKHYNNLVGDLIISCGIISYLAPCNVVFRNTILEHWKQYIIDLKIPLTVNYNLINVLGEENEINSWHYHGLPKDRFSTENAIIMNNSEHWCLFIDSQNQANQWIKAFEKKNSLIVIKLTDCDYMQIIQSGMKKGNPILIENVGEKLETLLDPSLLKRIYNNREAFYLDTDSNKIEYSRNFRLYITTRLLNPQYSYKIFSKLTVIDFSISNEVLQDRLLNIVISKEKSELQEKFETLLLEDVNNRKILKQQEDNILNTLSSTTTNILEDENAIKILDSSKNLSSNIIKKQEAAKKMSSEISKFRNTYIQFVKYCSDLFNTLNALACLNHMYRFSFSWFIQLYTRSILNSNRSIILEKRLGFLKSSFTKNFHRCICRALLEKDKILYSLLLCSKVLLYEQKTTEEEINYFISSNLKQFEAIPECTIDWLPVDTWINVYKLSKTLSVFSNLTNHFLHNKQSWNQYYNSNPLQNDLMPKPWVNDLSPFQKLILIKTLRPDQIFIQIMHIIDNTLGNTQSYIPEVKISQSYTESDCLTPLLFILPTCSPLLPLISAYAKKRGYLSKFISLSMSKCQEKKAELLIQTAQQKGNWIFLQNCHLVTDWLICLENICDNSNISNISLNFRLWLSSHPTEEFPISVLQNSIKITHDYPLSMKETLLNIYESAAMTNKNFFENCPGKDKIVLKFFFGLCAFHVIMRNRYTFGIYGWNIPYEFDHSDFHISILQLQNLINNTDDTTFNSLLYFIGDCNYGGKVMDNFDKKCLKYILNDYCNTSIIKDQQYTYSSDFEKLIPQKYEHDYVIKYIEQMSLDLPFQVFDFNKNGIIMRDTMIATEFFTSISYMNSTALIFNEQLVHSKVLTLIDSINSKLQDLFEVNVIRDAFTLLQDPLDRVLLHEIKLFKHVLNTVNKDVRDLKLALNGYIPFTDALKELTEEIYENEIPRVWKEMQEKIVTGNLPCYIENLLKRANFIKKWIAVGCPKIIYFDALFSCKMFLSALLLTFSKENNLSIEDIDFDFEIMTNVEEINTENTDAYFIHGLHLSGAQWNLEENILTKKVTNILYQNMPPIAVKCLQNKKEKNGIYECPVYVAPLQQIDRNTESVSKNYIISIPLKTDIDQSYWIKSGTALFCHIP